MTCALRPSLLAASAATALFLLLPWATEARPGFGAGGAGHLRVALTVSVEDITEACKRIAWLAERI